MVSYVRKRGKKSRRRYVKLTDANGKSRDVPVLTIMVAVWLNGGKPGLTPYHINGNLDDNNVNNIGFTTRKRLGSMTGASAKRRPVMKIDKQGQIVDFYSSAREAGRRNFMSYQAVIDRCHGKIKNPYALDGYTYLYDDGESYSDQAA
jgi:hypothetical protein